METQKKAVSQIKAGATLSYISIALSFIIAIIYTPIMLRLLGQSEYGLYNLAASVIGYLSLLSFGLGSTYVRYYSRYQVYDDQEYIARLNGMFLILFLVIAFIALMAGTFIVINAEFILGDKLSANELETAKILMAIMVFNMGISFPASIFSSHIIANEAFIVQKLIQLVHQLLNPFIILPVLFMGYGSVGMLAVITVLNILMYIANAVFCFKRTKIAFLFHRFDFSLAREMIVFSSFIFLNLVIDQINWNVDKFILGRFHGTFAVAVYGLAAQLNLYYLTLSYSIWNFFIPRVNRIVSANSDDPELTDLFVRVGRVLFIILSLILSGLIFLGRPFIHLWAGADYDETYFIALLLVIPATVPLIQTLGLAIQQAKNLHRFRSLVYFLIAVANVCISIPLAKLYGGIGAALGTAVSLIIGNGLIMNWYYHKKVGLDVKQFWFQIFKFGPSLLVPVIVGTVISLYIDLYQIIPFLISGAVYVTVFCLSLWFFGMNNYEKDLIGVPFLKLFKRVGLYK